MPRVSGLVDWEAFDTEAPGSSCATGACSLCRDWALIDRGEREEPRITPTPPSPPPPPRPTGFVVDKKRGILLTNRHVVKPGPVVAEAVFLNREEARAQTTPFPSPVTPPRREGGRDLQQAFLR